MDPLLSTVVTYGVKVVGGVLLLAVGWAVAGWAGRLADRLLGRSGRIDTTLRGFLASLVRYLILALVLIAVLNQLGVQTASLIALLGAAGLAVGLAVQGTLANLAAGVMLLIFRPFRAGQYVEVAGRSGTVESLNLFMTELTTPDNVQLLIPNGAVWGATVVNYSHHSRRRLDLAFGISYGDDIDRAMSVIREVIDEDDRALRDPEPEVMVSELGESAVHLTVRVWTRNENLWPLRWDLTRRIKEAFDAHDITIPFPQREMRVVRGSGPPL